MEYYNYIKALHLIFVITWFAGLFYIVRLFVYQVEALDKPLIERKILVEQYRLMQYRLWYIITWPSAVLATLLAVVLLVINPVLLRLGWMHIKLFFVLLLWFYQIKNHFIFTELQRNDKVKYTSNFFRMWNEFATIILFSVIFLVILKNSFNWIFGVIGLLVLIFVLILGIKIYKKYRFKNKR
ncbi:MAG: CopD family protein [Bacteroidota bacterium]|nr:CopD family protein [Bacteroidota bacterium]